VAHALGLDPSAVLDLSVSLNPVAPDPRPVVAAHLDALGTYPDPRRATDALAEAIGVDASRVLLTNGGAEAIALVAADLRVGWASENDFSLYRRHLPVLDPAGPVFRSNPHNPSGRLASPEATAAVWDEAFYPLATGRWTRGADDALVVGSLTKLFACPGLRLGYVLAPEADTIVRLAARQPEWAVGGLACAALVDLLARCDLRRWSAEVACLRRELIELLSAHGLAPQPSHAS
jgi:histidinol-phosphate/aromatic aminotransferase/cobyric acid decarboxylase-like protein